MTEKAPAAELFKGWVETLLSNLAVGVEEGTRARLIESCGRACALHYNAVEQARRIQSNAQDIDERLEQVNRQIPWCGSWRREEGTLTTICIECGCPLVREGWVKLLPAFCDCSRGWVQAVFEAVLDMPVRVELTQAIGRGDPVCRFVVYPLQGPLE
jgi:predicted hydrocarbon binding protein